ncbi:hypothetical protein C5938_15955 [Cronobacter sakazakii]|nr:hypothetical protein C3D68_13680 [Cronobacter sakazakii]PRO52580.1 hypothetical protein C5938_15955 [Cronobacter sakazakii]
MGGKACVTVKKVGAALPYPPYKTSPLTVGRVSVSAPAITLTVIVPRKKVGADAPYPPYKKQAV